MEREDAHIVVRGIRSADDLAYESNSAQINSHLSPNVETVFLLTNPAYSFVSSSAVRELAAFGASLQGLVPECVAKAITLRQDKSIERGFDLRF